MLHILFQEQNLKDLVYYHHEKKLIIVSCLGTSMIPPRVENVGLIVNRYSASLNYP